MAIRDRFRTPTMAIVAVLALFAMLLGGACSGDSDDDVAIGDSGTPEASGPGPVVVRPDTAGEPRGIRLGFSSLPPERTSDSYIQAFATAAQYADTILVQRTPPWDDFLPGGSVSKQTADSTRLETELLEQYGNLDLFYAGTNNGVHDGSVIGATSTSPGPRAIGSMGSAMTRARPLATPGHPGSPCNSSPTARWSTAAAPRTGQLSGPSALPTNTNGGTVVWSAW